MQNFDSFKDFLIADSSCTGHMQFVDHVDAGKLILGSKQQNKRCLIAH